MFLKHVGKQNDRKVAIIFREVPGEEHMCLVVYPEVLPSHMHDALMSAIETPESQSADNLGESIHSKMFSDGRPMLTALHAEGMIKKAKTETVIVTPTPNARLRLDELNDMLREMKMGEDAIKRMAEIDANLGMTGKARRRDDFGREIGAPSPTARGAYVAGSDAAKALDDASIANNLRAQAEKMHREAQGLLAESARMMKEAAEMSGAVPETASASPKRGRPSKTKAANASQS